MTRAEREQYAKKFVNDIRHEHGARRLAKLKRGIPGHLSHCVIAVSLPCRIADFGGDVVRLDGWQYHDPELSRFMEDFDQGKYPHLEIPKTPIKMKRPGERKLTVIE